MTCGERGENDIWVQEKGDLDIKTAHDHTLELAYYLCNSCGHTWTSED